LFTVCVGKSTFVLLTLLLRSWAVRLATVVAGVQESYCRMAVRWPTEQLTFVAKALSRGSLRKYQGSEQDVSVCALVNNKWFDFNKRGCFLLFRFGVSSLSSPPPPIFPATRRITRMAGYKRVVNHTGVFHSDVFSNVLHVSA
jgi:hypothetical protein